MAHRHLILAYVMTCLIQLGYVGFLGMKWRAVRRLEREQPRYEAAPGAD